MKDKTKTIVKDIPDDVHEIWCNWQACLDLRDAFVKKRWFGYKKAKKSAVDAQKAKVMFWKMCIEIYPEMEKANPTYDAVKQQLSWIESTEEIK